MEVQRPGSEFVAVSIAALAATRTPSLAAVRVEELSRLEAAVDALPDEQCEALLLVRYEGLSLAEAGEQIKRTPDAVRVLVASALVRLGMSLTAQRPATLAGGDVPRKPDARTIAGRDLRLPIAFPSTRSWQATF